MFASLRTHRNYRLYFGGQLVSQLGTWLQNAAQAWLVLDLTHSAQAVGVVAFCLYSPYAFLGLIGGALADRWNRARMLMLTQTAMAACAVALTLVAYVHVDRVWVIDLIAVLRGTIMVFNNPSRQGLMVELVGRRELPNAIALNSSLNNATRIVGPALAGVLIATVGVATCFALNALSFIAIVAALGAMRPAEFAREAPRTRVPLLRSIRDGLAYARHTKTVAIVLTMLFVVATVSINFSVVLPVLARYSLHGGPRTYGVITAVFGLGAFAGALFTASRKKSSPALLLFAAAGFGAAQLGVALQHSITGVACALFVTGVCYTVYTATSNALVQLATPGFMQGRVGGLYNYVFLATGPLGSLLAGGLCERYGASSAFLAGGAAALAMALTGVLLRPWPMPTGTIGARRRPARGRRALPE